MANAGGTLEKDGEPLKLAIKCTSSGDTATKIAQIAQQQKTQSPGEKAGN